VPLIRLATLGMTVRWKMGYDLWQHILDLSCFLLPANGVSLASMCGLISRDAELQYMIMIMQFCLLIMPCYIF
jgi:hypothetical protein